LNLFLKNLPSEALQKLHEPIPLANEKSLSNAFNILSIRKTIRTDQEKFDRTVFVELFTVHLLERNSSFYDLPKLRYMRNKKCYNIMDTRIGIEKMSPFFSNTFLNFKLHSMFNVNIPKDAARSELSCYIY
jgi:hypothetical protein